MWMVRPGFCWWNASAHFWEPGCCAESQSQYSMVPLVPPPPAAPPQAAVRTVSETAAAPRESLLNITASSLDPAEADGVDDLLGEAEEQDQHRQCRDERGGH